jgi:hypothetical protein
MGEVIFCLILFGSRPAQAAPSHFMRIIFYFTVKDRVNPSIDGGRLNILQMRVQLAF